MTSSYPALFSNGSTELVRRIPGHLSPQGPLSASMIQLFQLQFHQPREKEEEDKGAQQKEVFFCKRSPGRLTSELYSKDKGKIRGEMRSEKEKGGQFMTQSSYYDGKRKKSLHLGTFTSFIILKKKTHKNINQRISETSHQGTVFSPCGQSGAAHSSLPQLGSDSAALTLQHWGFHSPFLEIVPEVLNPGSLRLSVQPSLLLAMLQHAFSGTTITDTSDTHHPQSAKT